MDTPHLLLDGLILAEAPRWHEGRLWFSDILAHTVIAVDERGRSEVMADLGGGKPSGLGFLPDGRLLVVDMDAVNRRVLRLESGTLITHADLSGLAIGILNDMVVDASGRAYVGSAGQDFFSMEEQEPRLGNLILAEPDGTARVVAEGLDGPNGPVITPDGRTYIVAESTAERLTAFDVGSDGSLTGRRVFADLSPAAPDGIALDAEGAIWCATPGKSECIRVLKGGAVTDRIELPGALPLACALGGADGHTLFLVIRVGGNHPAC